ncbi:hypothetical protein LPB90_13050 [Chryseobacterium sp. LC2016-29]|uniref:hypothetical protein n=1 Tax=Chryseobacterium sp. LC2016-29 TaxID=2897331 RepID=UPI001E5A92D7|nr:hypothetical protein [Chryseobacterium sp. LC2016-29]MCD0479382.1 hypothetical protein [Chryseobacterium sp. LC2016-29]
MISIIIAIGVFRYYQKLAVRNGKVHWKYGFLGMGICLGVQLLFWLIYKFIGMLLNSQEPDLFSATVVTTLGWVASIFTVWFVHRHLEKSWRKDVILTNASEIEEIGAEHTKDLH